MRRRPAHISLRDAAGIKVGGGGVDGGEQGMVSWPWKALGVRGQVGGWEERGELWV